MQPAFFSIRVCCSFSGVRTRFTQSKVCAVAQFRKDKHPFSPVRSTDFSRAEYSPRCAITCFFQIADDCGKSKRDVSFDVFKEAIGRLNNSNCVDNEGPEVPRVFRSESLPGCAEGLTGISRSKDVHLVVKLCTWEGFNIRPDRCEVHESRFHFCDQVRAGECFDLSISDDAQISDSSTESEMNASVSGTPLKNCNFFGTTHTYNPPPVRQKVHLSLCQRWRLLILLSGHLQSPCTQ